MQKDLKTFHTGTYLLNSDASADMSVINDALNVFKLMPLLPGIIDGVQHEAVDKMVYAEAKFEGNPATFSQVQNIIKLNRDNYSQDATAINVINIYEAFKMLEKTALPLTQDIIVKTHKELTSSLPNIKETNGNFRNGGTKADIKYINVNYIPPQSTIDVNFLVKNLIVWLEEDLKDINPIIKGVLLHLHLKKIQPYSNCNGHLARLLEQWYMSKHGVNVLPQILLAIYNEKKDDYYKAVSVFYDTSDISEFIRFISENIKSIVLGLRDANYNAIRSMLAERVLADLLNEKKLIQRQYDLLCLLKKGEAFAQEDLQLKKPFTKLYAKVSRTTVGRDIAKLESMKLIKTVDGKYILNN